MQNPDTIHMKERRREETMPNVKVMEYTENYMEKVFYFCLKKTGNAHDAEDLSQDIALCIFSELHRGRMIEHFSAWVWKIARNRYSKWADKKHRRLEYETSLDEGDLTDEPYEEIDLVHREDLSLLRRELAFISSDYRDIVLAYYIENRSVLEIAEKLSLPKGTVQCRLFRARNILKEGMTMAREFGARSYKAENVSFAASGNQPSGLPWSIVKRKIPKNILLEASNNPSTLEELSMALGIAMPYMEEEVEILRKGTLLKKIGDKYITNFFIFSRECQEAVYTAQRERSGERSRLADEIADDLIPELRRLGAVRNDMTDDEIKWWAFIYTLDYCRCRLPMQNLMTLPPRENGETWGFVGYEVCKLPENLRMDHNITPTEIADFQTYGIYEYEFIYLKDIPWREGITMLADILKTEKNFSALSESEKLLWKEHRLDRLAHIEEDGAIVPDILVFENGSLQKVRDFICTHKNFDALMSEMQDAAEKTETVLKSFSTEVLRDQLSFYVNIQLCDLRMMSVHDEVESGKLIIPEDPKKRKTARWLIMK